MCEPALLGEVGERDMIKSTTTSSWLRASMGARITIMTESTGGVAREMVANNVSRSIPSFSTSFKSPDVRHGFVHHAAMTTTAQALASLCTCSSWSYLAISDSESTDTPGRPAGCERTTASDAPEFEFLADAELLCNERRQDPGKGEIPAPGSVAVKEGRGVCHSPQREQLTVLPTVPPPSAIAIFK